MWNNILAGAELISSYACRPNVKHDLQEDYRYSGTGAWRFTLWNYAGTPFGPQYRATFACKIPES